VAAKIIFTNKHGIRLHMAGIFSPPSEARP
jgi:hypothetical protein